MFTDCEELKGEGVMSAKLVACETADKQVSNEEGMSEKNNVEQWLAIQKEAGLKIDPETAEVDWCYAQTLDPYGVYSNLPEECQQVGREYFARSPGSEIWVHLHDLPEETSNALWQRHQHKLAFSAGLAKRASDQDQSGGQA
jgi:hypothetical protein